MKKDNIGDDSNPNLRIVPANRQQQLDLYDSLPRRWRQLVDSLPVPQDLREVEAVRRQFGEERGFDLIVSVYRDQYPTWTLSKEYF